MEAISSLKPNTLRGGIGKTRFTRQFDWQQASHISASCFPVRHWILVVQLKGSKGTSVLPTLISALMDFGTAPFQNVWARRTRDCWCLIIQDEGWKNIILMWLFHFQRTLSLWRINQSYLVLVLQMTRPSYWKIVGTLLMAWVEVGQNLHDILMLLRLLFVNQAPLLFKTTVS